MAHQVPRGDDSPVCVGTVLGGSDPLLFNPDISPAQWRRHRLRAALRLTTVLKGFVATSLAALGFWTATGAAAVLMAVVGILALATSVLAAWADSTDTATGHRRSDYFFRIQDFEPGSRDTVRALLGCVDGLYRSSARDWIDPTLLRRAHHVAWQTLSCLHQTRHARMVAAELAADPNPDVAPLSAAAHRALAVTDETVTVVVRHLHDCVALADAWAAKLRYAALAEQANLALAELADRTIIRRIAATAETLPQDLFAWVTAARDVTGAGTFAWERPPTVPTTSQ